jgi:hypothetical protein
MDKRRGNVVGHGKARVYQVHRGFRVSAPIWLARADAGESRYDD